MPNKQCIIVNEVRYFVYVFNYYLNYNLNITFYVYKKITHLYDVVQQILNNLPHKAHTEYQK